MESFVSQRLSSKEDRKIFQLMFALAEKGISPEEYNLFWQIFNAVGDIVNNITDIEEDEHEDQFIDDNFGTSPYYHPKIKEYSPLEDAENHTLVLKISLKDVKKPPMWREISIPADFTFEDLHYAIQAVSGLTDSHLWQFNKTAYDSNLIIGHKSDNEYEMGLQRVHEATKTHLTQFLQGKGDKLEYVYDFGDDWIFTVEVKELRGEKTDYPVCVKFKSEFNPAEDMGGVWWYLNARDTYTNWDSMSKKEKKELVDRSGFFESPEDYFDFLKSCLIDLDEVNESLQTITR